MLLQLYGTKIRKKSKFDSVMVDRTPPTLSTYVNVLLCRLLPKILFRSTWNRRNHWEQLTIRFKRDNIWQNREMCWFIRYETIALSTNGAFCLSWVLFKNKSIKILTINIAIAARSLSFTELKHFDCDNNFV